MRFIKRLMEIKEEQLDLEQTRNCYIRSIEFEVMEILKELKGRKDGKSKNKRN